MRGRRRSAGLTERDDSHTPLPIAISAGNCLGENYWICAAPRIAALLAPGGSYPEAYLEMLYPGPGASQPCPAVDATLVVSLPESGGDLSVPFGSMYTCVSAVMGRFELPAQPFPTAAPPLALEVTLRDVLESVRAGDTLRFVVGLTNTSGLAPVAFGDSCPPYTISMVRPRSLNVNGTLNCRPAGAIAPGQTVNFEMEMDMPDSAELGLYYLDWDPTDFGVPATGELQTAYTVTVVAPSP